jgi:hypothetical protein
MMKSLKMGITLVLVFCFVSVNSIPVRAEYVVGVKSGDWIKHNIQLEGVNPITHDYWTKITVQKVDGTVISGIFEEKGPGGLTSQEFSVDITKSGSSYVVKDYMFIPANLTAGSVIPALNLTVQGITTLYDREAVYTIFTGGDPGWGGFFNVSYCWDRSTGVLLDYQPGSVWVKIAETSLWGTWIDWTFWTLVAMVIVIVVTISLGLFIRHRRHLKRVAESYVYGPPPTSKSEASG